MKGQAWLVNTKTGERIRLHPAPAGFARVVVAEDDPRSAAQVLADMAAAPCVVEGAGYVGHYKRHDFGAGGSCRRCGKHRD